MVPEKGHKYGKVPYQHYFQYILCVNIFIMKIYLKKNRNLKNYFVCGGQTFYPKKSEFGSRPIPKPKTQRDADSEFDSKHFGIEINKCLKFVKPKSFWI